MFQYSIVAYHLSASIADTHLDTPLLKTKKEVIRRADHKYLPGLLPVIVQMRFKMESSYSEDDHFKE